VTLIIRNRQIVEDDWVALADDAPLPTSGQAIIPFQRWQAEHHVLASGGVRLGVRVPNTANVVEIWSQLSTLPLIALEFPAFSDGRAYSQARLLRRLGYKGELRAVGDVMRDEVREMHRCGFDTLVPRPDQDLQACLKGFDDFSLNYQGAADDPTTISRRRQA
jgi:uncharacterized protein (DUF934 family)